MLLLSPENIGWTRRTLKGHSHPSCIPRMATSAIQCTIIALSPRSLSTPQPRQGSFRHLGLGMVPWPLHEPPIELSLPPDALETSLILPSCLLHHQHGTSHRTHPDSGWAPIPSRTCVGTSALYFLGPQRLGCGQCRHPRTAPLLSFIPSYLTSTLPSSLFPSFLSASLPPSLHLSLPLSGCSWGHSYCNSISESTTCSRCPGLRNLGVPEPSFKCFLRAAL